MGSYITGFFTGEEVENSFTFPDIPPRREYKFQVFDDISKVNTYSNFGILPSNCLHRVFLFSDLRTISRIFRTCKLFHLISNTNLFWKDYASLVIKRKFEDGKEVNNWKEYFFKSFLVSWRKSDDYYEKMLFPKDKEDVDKGGGKKRYRYGFINRNLFKIIVIGDSNVGKTTLQLTFSTGKFPGRRCYSTIGMDFQSREVYSKTGSPVALQIWDTSGQERFQSLGNSFYRGADVIVICFAINYLRTFENVKKWYEELELQLNEDEHLNDKVLICGTKTDLVNERAVDISMVKKLCKELGLHEDRDFVECSSKEKKNVNTVFGMCVEKAVRNSILQL